MSFDYVIVGGGPVGLYTAIQAALRQRSSVVIERCHGPVDKACGEGLMPPCVARLQAAGVVVPEGGSFPFRGIRYVDGATVAQAAFVEGPGLGVRRLALSEGLRARAQALGVEIREGAEALEWAESADGVALQTTLGAVSGKYLVAADGLHSKIRKDAGFTVKLGPARRLGIRRHFAVEPWSDYVEVYWGDGVEAYVTPVGPRRVDVAFLWRGGKGNYDLFLQRFPELAARLGAVDSQIRGAGPFDVRVDRRVRGRVLLVGDAAGYVDAITGEGISLGFEAAEALVEATVRDRPGDYERAWVDVYARYEKLTRLMLWVARYPWLRSRVVRALSKSPSSFQGFLALNTGAYGWGQALPSAATVGLRLLSG